MARKNYTVVENTPGYLPESEPEVFSNKRDAMQYMAESVRGYMEDAMYLNYTEPGYKLSKTGSARAGFIRVGSNADYDLGRVWELMEHTA